MKAAIAPALSDLVRCWLCSATGGLVFEPRGQAGRAGEQMVNGAER